MSSIENTNIKFPSTDKKMRHALIRADICPECGNHLDTNAKICSSDKCSFNAMPDYLEVTNTVHDVH